MTRPSRAIPETKEKDNKEPIPRLSQKGETDAEKETNKKRKKKKETRCLSIPQPFPEKSITNKQPPPLKPDPKLNPPN